MRVLVIDDQILLRECLVKAINSQPDFRIIGETGSLDEGIALAINLCPDIVLLGTESTNTSGLEAIKAILYNRPEIKIVILSIYESEDSLFTALRYGARGYIPKNIPLEHLLASLRALGRDEAALSRTMISRIVQEFTRLGRLVSREESSEQCSVSDVLTAREIEVLEQLGRDASNQEIAERLMISQNTVKVHISHILEKLNLRNRHEVGRFARRHGITSNRVNPSERNNGSK